MPTFIPGGAGQTINPTGGTFVPSTQKKKKKKRSFWSDNPVTNLARDVGTTAIGLGPGLVELGRGVGEAGAYYGTYFDPYLGAKRYGSTKRLDRIVKGIEEAYKYNYGPLAHGDIGEFASRLQEHPLGPILDALTLASLGVGGAVKGAGALSRAGMIEKVPAALRPAAKEIYLRPPRLRPPEGFEAAGGTLRGIPVTGGELTRRLKIGTDAALKKLPADYRVLGEWSRYTRVVNKQLRRSQASGLLKVLPWYKVSKNLSREEGLALTLRAQFPTEGFLKSYQGMLEREMAAEETRLAGLRSAGKAAVRRRDVPDKAYLRIIKNEKVLKYFREPTPAMMEARQVAEEMDALLVSELSRAGVLTKDQAEWIRWEPTLVALGAKYRKLTVEEAAAAGISKKLYRERGPYILEAPEGSTIDEMIAGIKRDIELHGPQAQVGEVSALDDLIEHPSIVEQSKRTLTPRPEKPPTIEVSPGGTITETGRVEGRVLGTFTPPRIVAQNLLAMRDDAARLPKPLGTYEKYRLLDTPEKMVAWGVRTWPESRQAILDAVKQIDEDLYNRLMEPVAAPPISAYRPMHIDVPPIAFNETKDYGQFLNSIGRNHKPWNLTPYGEQDLSKMRVFLSADKESGFALTKEGDLVNLFANPASELDSGLAALTNAVEKGAKTLDCYDNGLPRFYSQFGFQETGRMKFNPDFAPPGVVGQPDVVFMTYKGGPRNTIRERIGNFDYKPSSRYFRDWDKAKSFALSKTTDDLGAARLRGATTPRMATAQEPMYFPHVTELKDIRIPRTGGGMTAPRSPVYLRTGVVQAAGRMILDPQVWTAKFLENVKFLYYNEKHSNLILAAVPVDELPNTNWRFITRKNERISNLERTSASWDEYMTNLQKELGADPYAALNMHGTADDLLTGDPALAEIDEVTGKRLALPIKTAKGIVGDYAPSSRAANRLLNPLKYATTVWRALVLNLRVGWLVNNVVGNTFLYAIKNAGPEGIRAWVQSVGDALGEGGVRRLWNDKMVRSRLTAADMIELFPEQYVGTFFGTQIPTYGRFAGAKAFTGKYSPTRALRSVDVYYEQALRRAMINKLTRTSPEFKKVWEEMPETTRTVREAMRKSIKNNPRLQRRISAEVNNALGDFFNLSDFEQRVLRGAAPFYAWYRAITSIMLRLPIDAPLRTNILTRIGAIGDQIAAEDYGLYYLKGAYPLGGNKRISLKSTNPFTTPIDVATGLAATTLGTGTKTDVQTFTGMFNPIWYELAFGLSQAQAGQSLTGLPPIAAGPYEVVRSLPETRLIWPYPSQLYEGDPRIRELLAFLGIPIKTVKPSVAKKRAKQQ